MDRKWWFPGLFLLAVVTALAIFGCTPTAAPTPTATKPASTVTVAATPTTAAPKPTTGPASSNPTTSSQLATVRFASPGYVSDAGVYIAMEKGYFKEQSINTELVPIKTGTDAPPLLARGDIEVAGGSTSAALYNAIARGIDLKIVADKGSASKGFGFQGFVLRKDLVDQIKTPADLKGKKIAAPCSNCAVDYLLSLYLKPAGLTLKDVDWSELSGPDSMAAFANKSLDMAIMVEPNPTLTVDKGLGVYWIKTDEIDPDEQTAQIIISDTFAKNGDLARRWVTAYIKALRDYNDAFVKNKNKAEIIAILAKNSPVKDLPLYDKMTMPGLNPNGKVNAESLLKQQDFFIQNGGMKDKVDLNKAIDTQFSDYAVQQLGAYK